MKSDILASMQLKSTEELIEIWKNNDQSEWTNDAFGVVADILLERLGSLPEQDKPIEEISDIDSPSEKLLDDYLRKERLVDLVDFVFYLGISPAIICILFIAVSLFAILSPRSITVVGSLPWYVIVGTVLFVSAALLRKRTKLGSVKARQLLLERISKGSPQ